jgi:uncharacterized protein YdaU (DUF1376 family)
MHYYKRNVGDYHRKAGRLSMLEHGAYTLLIDACYDREKFPTRNQAMIWCLARTPEEVAAVEFVLFTFFEPDEEGRYTQNHILEDLAIYHGNKETNKRIALEREEKRRKSKLMQHEACTVGDEPYTNLHLTNKPITNNHKTVTNKDNTQSRANALDYGCWPSIPSDQVLKDWLDMRKRLKASVSQTVINNFATELNKAAGFGYSVDQCLSEAVTRNWRGFKFDWMQEKQNAAHQRSNRETLSERANRAADEAFGTGSQSRVLEGCFDILNDNGADQLTGSRGLPDLGQRSG